MYASELINQLSHLVTKHGDHPVKNTDSEDLEYTEFYDYDGDTSILLSFDEN